MTSTSVGSSSLGSYPTPLAAPPASARFASHACRQMALSIQNTGRNAKCPSKSMSETHPMRLESATFRESFRDSGTWRANASYMYARISRATAMREMSARYAKPLCR